jgi:glycosyltransferase involved in cell wall biosynthesis
MGTFMKPYLSIVIPAFNASESLRGLLVSLGKSSYKKFEVIIGDDASNEQLTPRNLQPSKQRNSFPLRVVRLTRNRGPAAARNAAANRAQGAVIVFLDSDVQVYPDTLAKIADKFREDGDLTAITGVWDKHQKSKDFFPQFKAIRDWSYWTNERDRDGYYYLFSTRIAAIKRDVFLRLGGFNEVFRQMEDVEFTYRIAKRYAIIFTPDVRVHHEFEGFWAVAKKYFWRSFYWTRLWRERKKFDPVATTMWESMAGVSAVLAVCSLSLGLLLFFIIPVDWVKMASLIGTGVFLCIHIFLIRKFLRFVLAEKGFVFMLKSLGTGIVLYCVIVAGSLYYQIKLR